MLLNACSPSPAVNTSGCSWARPFTAVASHPDIYAIFAANESVMRPLTDEINAHNKARKQNCGQ